MTDSRRHGKEGFEAQYPAQDAELVCAAVEGNCNQDRPLETYNTYNT